MQGAGRNWHMVALVSVLALTSCSDDEALSGFDGSSNTSNCSIPTDKIFDGGPGKDGIPALTNPRFVSADQISYLQPDSRVIGLLVDGQAYTVPHNILWWHEIVNLDAGSQQLAVTYCPLTGSSMAFDREAVGGDEFGVSGLLFETNLIMYNRSKDESLWPQMARGARCGGAVGTELPMVPVFESTWAGWTSLHPDAKVISEDTGFSRNYELFPYGSYEVESNSNTLFPISRQDGRRPPKERVLGVWDGEEKGIAFPFGELDKLGALSVVESVVAGQRIVVFWDRSKRAAMAYDADGRTFAVTEGLITDLETASTWRVDGLADGGDLAGTRLEPVEGAYVSFWFAWAIFQPDTELWTAS